MANIVGTNAANTLVGTFQNDSIFGLAGNDVLVRSAGNDLLDGGIGFDTVDYRGLGRAVTLLSQGLISKSGLGTDRIVNVERIIGDVGQFNAIDGSTGVGPTSFNIDLRFNRLTVNNIPGIGAATFEVFNFINVFGTPNADSIIGNDFNNTINGLGGNDTISGGGGNDFLLGGAGNDRVAGDAGNDVLLGTDTFSRGRGEVDTLTGGFGNDSFVLGNRAGSFYGFNGNFDSALIQDFSFGDTIVLGTGETYFARRDNAGFDVFVARGSSFDLIADVRSNFFAALPNGAFQIGAGQSLGVFFGSTV